MKVVENIKEKPIEVIAAVVLIAVGIVVAALTKETWQQGAGGAVATVGGALLSHIASDVSRRRKAVDCLKPELELTSRHLQDTVGRIGNNVQMYQTGDLDAETAIDRISQLTSSLHSGVNDLYIMVGTPPDYQTIVEIVSGNLQVAKRLEQLAESGPANEAGKQELDQIRDKLDSMRTQLASMKKDFGGIDVVKSTERIRCPHCAAEATVMLGNNIGDSAVHTCTSCNQRFHVHRDALGNTFTRPWGSTKRRMEIACPECGGNIPLNYDPKKPYEERYCMYCTCLIRIECDGKAAKIKDAGSIETKVLTYKGNVKLLRCPKCQADTAAIWWTADVVRAVCSKCGDLLEYVTAVAATDREGTIETGIDSQ